MSLNLQVELKILKDRNHDLEERETLRQLEMERLKKRYDELRANVMQDDLLVLLEEKDDKIDKLEDRCRDLQAASLAVLKAYEHSYCSDDQRAAIRTIRAVLDDD